jgi:hypothetical protein
MNTLAGKKLKYRKPSIPPSAAAVNITPASLP